MAIDFFEARMHTIYGIQVNGGREGLIIEYDHTGQLVFLDQILVGEVPINGENRLCFEYGAKHPDNFFRTGLCSIDT